MGDFLIVAAEILFLIVVGAVLLLHMISLPANWIFLGLSLLYALVTGFSSVGWVTLLILAILMIAWVLLDGLFP